MKLMTFSSMGDTRVRPTHQKLHGTTLPKDHPFWKTHTAPLDWRCRCRTYAITPEQADILGRPVLTEAPAEKMVEYVNKKTGVKETVPESISPGWLVDSVSPVVDPKAALTKLHERKLAEIEAIAAPGQLALDL